MDKEMERLFNEWVDSSTSKPELKEYLHEQKQSYYSFLVFFLKDTVRKK